MEEEADGRSEAVSLLKSKATYSPLQTKFLGYAVTVVSRFEENEFTTSG